MDLVKNRGTWGVLLILGAMLSIQPTSVVLAEHPGVNHSHPTVDVALASYEPAQRVAGRMTIAGSDTMQPILAKLAQEFRRWHPDAKIMVQGEDKKHNVNVIDSLIGGYANNRQGDGDTDGHLGAQQVKVLALSRELSSEELKKFSTRHGHDPLAIEVARDAVAIYVNTANPIQGLTLEQLDAIFSETRKRGAPEVTRWGQVGLQDEWSQAAIRVYGRDKRSTGTRPFFAQTVLLNGEFKETVQEQAGPASVVLAVTNDRLGIGYSGIGFASSVVREVPLAEAAGQPFIEPTSETVTSGRYPLSRTLILYVNKGPKEELDPVIREFLKFISTQPAQRVVVKAGVYPLTASQASKNLAKLSENGLQSAALAEVAEPR